MQYGSTIFLVPFLTKPTHKEQLHQSYLNSPKYLGEVSRVEMVIIYSNDLKCDQTELERCASVLSLSRGSKGCVWSLTDNIQHHGCKVFTSISTISGTKL